jgi:hypothetical protein
MRARPRWGLLYAIPALTAAGFFAVASAEPVSTPNTLLVAALTGLAFGAMAWWVRANRAALDQAEWCACASSTISVRVISSTATDARTDPEAGRGPARPPDRPRVTTGEPSATLSV